jgi:hypothetical protein
LQRRHQNAALDGRADDGREFAEKGALLFRRERQCILDAFGQRTTVPQQKEQQVQHDK